MASNYTTNYKLPLWEGGDSVLREEFNEAHEKVDAAIENMSIRTLLADITVNEPIQQTDIDLSSVDMTQYARLSIRILGGYSETGYGVALLLNGADASSDYYSMESAVKTGQLILAQLTPLSGETVSECFVDVQMFCRGFLATLTGISGNDTTNSIQIQRGCTLNTVLKPTTLETIGFRVKSSDNAAVLTAGTRFTIWGIKH